MYVDAHTHLDFPAFDADRPAVLERARAAGVTQIVVSGVAPATWARARALRGPGVFWTAGLHPQWIAGVAEGPLMDALADAFAGPEAPCAVGEIGLDRRSAEPERQSALFRAQLDFARARGLPAVLHVVQRHGEALALARADGLPARTVVHGFTGSAEVARAWLALGAHLSLGGAVAQPRARRARAAAAIIPRDRLLLETDAPDQPLPGAPPRNEPAALIGVAAAVAALRQVEPEALLQAASDNARRLFDLP